MAPAIPPADDMAPTRRIPVHFGRRPRTRRRYGLGRAMVRHSPQRSLDVAIRRSDTDLRDRDGWRRRTLARICAGVNLFGECCGRRNGRRQRGRGEHHTKQCEFAHPFASVKSHGRDLPIAERALRSGRKVKSASIAATRPGPSTEPRPSNAADDASRRARTWIGLDHVQLRMRALLRTFPRRFRFGRWRTGAAHVSPRVGDGLLIWDLADPGLEIVVPLLLLLHLIGAQSLLAALPQIHTRCLSECRRRQARDHRRFQDWCFQNCSHSVSPPAIRAIVPRDARRPNLPA